MLKQIRKDHRSLNIFCLSVFFIWTCFQLGVLVYYKEREKQIVIILGEEHGRAALQKDITYRAWNARHGGVYVPITTDSPPNPYLTTPNKTVKTNAQQQLTLINPAYMTRQVHEIGMEMFNTQGHLTSLNVIRKENKPTPWEVTALKSFEEGETFYSNMVTIANAPYLRVMLPLMTDKPCLKCHADQGYKLGDVRGGISTVVSLDEVKDTVEGHCSKTIFFHFITYFLGFAGLVSFYIYTKKQLIIRNKIGQEKEDLIDELQEALDELTTLREIIPICASCKKIRDDQGYWNQLESYLAKHADIKFSHSICPDCKEKLYPNL